MGQQQLLLLVLGIVIVGIAVVAGIQAFSEGKSKSARDAAVSDAMRIVSDAQAWMLKPSAFGGGAGTTDPISFVKLGYPNAPTATESSPNPTGVQSDGSYTTVSGCYTIAGTVNNGTLTVRLKDNAGACESGTFATVAITGPNVSDITWSYTTSAPAV